VTWTPGPWADDRRDLASDGYHIWADEHVATVNPPSSVADDDAAWGVAEANARLICLAPEMAELLARTDLDFRHQGDSLEFFLKRVNAYREEAAALLARARGEDAPPIPEDTVQEEGTLQGGS